MISTGLPGPVPLPSWHRTRVLGPPVQSGGTRTRLTADAAPRRCRRWGLRRKGERGYRGSWGRSRWSLGTSPPALAKLAKNALSAPPAVGSETFAPGSLMSNGPARRIRLSCPLPHSVARRSRRRRRERKSFVFGSWGPPAASERTPTSPKTALGGRSVINQPDRAWSGSRG